MYDSRLAPKFVIRFDSLEKRQAVTEAAGKVHISMNAFILQAVDEKLSRERHTAEVMAAAYSKLLNPILS